LNSHPGDLWPSKRAIKKRIDDTDLVCFLSETIHKIFLEGNHGRRNHDKPIIVLKHPVLPIKKNFKLIEVASGRPFLLIIGRMRSYKGVAEFLHIWVNRRSMLDHVLVIVGEGILETSVVEQARVRDDVIIENEWVDDARFYSYLKSSEVVVFPYIEATQSGIIPIAMDLNKVIVVNNVGALREQIAGYPNGLVIDHSKSAEFMMAELEQVVRSSVLISRKNFVKTTLNMEEFSAQLCSILLKI
jgi:glycosyltransferase involved in cell wall biosynthesis